MLIIILKTKKTWSQEKKETTKNTEQKKFSLSSSMWTRKGEEGKKFISFSSILTHPNQKSMMFHLHFSSISKFVGCLLYLKMKKLRMFKVSRSKRFLIKVSLLEIHFLIWQVLLYLKTKKSRMVSCGRVPNYGRFC